MREDAGFIAVTDKYDEKEFERAIEEAAETAR